MTYNRHFIPVGKIFPTDETIKQRLERLARASLPRMGTEPDERDRNSHRHCVCGELLPVKPKIRNKRPVCDDCAIITPRMVGGKRPSCVCAGCGVVHPRLKLKIKGGALYCKKCLKIKYNIDF